MDKKFFPTNNYYEMTKAVKALVSREPSLPGMGLVYGRWGLGKSEAIDYFYGDRTSTGLRSIPCGRPGGCSAASWRRCASRRSTVPTTA